PMGMIPRGRPLSITAMAPDETEPSPPQMITRSAISRMRVMSRAISGRASNFSNVTFSPPAVRRFRMGSMASLPRLALGLTSRRARLPRTVEAGFSAKVMNIPFEGTACRIHPTRYRLRQFRYEPMTVALQKGREHMDDRTGACLCGAVRFRTTGPLRGVIYCHCSQCRRQTGHHYAATNVPDANLQVEGGEKL